MSSRFLWFARLITVLAAVVLSLAVIEAGLATFRPQPTYQRLLDLLAERYVTGDFLPFSLRPSYVARAPSMEYPGQMVTVTTNRLGLRGPETTVEKPPATKRVITLGDSYTFGVYVGDDDIYPRVLERRLRQDGHAVEVLNAGYADGWSPDEHYAWLKRTGLLFSPDLIVYGMFVGNDIPPDASVRNNWADLDEQGLPTRIVNPSIYVDDLGRIRSKVKNNQTVGVERIYRVPWLRESHLAVLLGKRLERQLTPEAGLKHYGADVGSLSFLFNKELSPAQLAGEDVFLQVVQGMNRLSLEHGSRFLVMLIPINFQVEPRFLDGWNNSSGPIVHDYFSRLGQRLSERNIPFINLLDMMRATPGHYYPANGEVHFNPQGHQFAAEQLRRAIEDLRLLDPPSIR